MLAKGSAPWIMTLVAISALAAIAHITVYWPYTGIITLLGLAGLIFFIFFFRDPERESEYCCSSMTAPADGKIVDIRGRKICIFMNVHNVHVNRAPLTGTVIAIEHKKGGYRPAFSKDSERNERSHIFIDTEHGIVEVTQIAGTIARRIVSYVQVGDQMVRGQRFGMIRFGSRVDVTIPENFEILCTKGEKVTAGMTVIARKRNTNDDNVQELEILTVPDSFDILCSKGGLVTAGTSVSYGKE
ncbi:MAG: phosphatidylserine decarboxylase [Methanolobus sp.]|uniref:phosphatidylserine decarboxylase n=1 Tax=Methanolobus sp. TaxID=1874737 RepID=UPI0027322B78|nr:phosphatidylserine decarboxylase [Methanolobus sp.]MDP2217430.1 phosphatidylserine decarboxylase [Methanolobus sp.]